MPQLANRVKRIRLDDDTGTAGRLKSQIVVPVDKIHMATNDAAAANKILHGRSNMTVHTVDNFESMLDHIVDLEQQKILVIVWQGQLLPDVLKDLVDSAKQKTQFLSVLTSTETEAHAEHTQLPDDEDMLAVMGRRILKAATNAGLKPTRNPISAYKQAASVAGYEHATGSLYEEQPVYQVANGAGTTMRNVAIATEACIHAFGPDATGMTRPLVVDQLESTRLDANALAERIHSAMPATGTVDGDVIELISNAVEIRLRSLLAHLAAVAEHRLEPLRLNQFYDQVDDPCNQLRYMERIERVAADRREALEREALIKLSKSKGKDKDAMDRARQLQKQDQEARLKRESNDAAIAALGGSRLKRIWAESSNPFDHQVASSTSVQIHRPRIKRVTMRDLQFVLATDTIAPNSQLRHRIAFTSLSSESNAQL